MNTETEIRITGHLSLDHCWVCGCKDGLEGHHVCPRAYGGTNGPVVTLCGVCHSVLHKQSHKPKNNRKFTSKDIIQAAKLTYLSECVFNARIATRRIARGRVLSMNLSPDLHLKLKAVMHVDGTPSIEKTVQRIIEVAYKSRFPLKE